MREREIEAWIDSDVMEKDCEIKKGKIKGREREREKTKKSDIAFGKDEGKRKRREMRGEKKMIEIISPTPTSSQSAEFGRI